MRNVLSSIKTNWQTESLPGIDVCHLNCNTSQAYIAATLQTLMNFNAKVEDSKIYDLVQKMKNNTNNMVDLNKLLGDFKGNYLDNASFSCKVTEWAKTLFSLFGLDKSPDYSLSWKDTENGKIYNSVIVNCVSDKSHYGDLYDNVAKLVEHGGVGWTLSYYWSEFFNFPKHLFISVEKMLPAEIIYTMSADPDFKTLRFKDISDEYSGVRYRLKSMVLRKIAANLMTDGSIDYINSHNTNDYTCIVNTGNKFVRIDSLRPTGIQSCSNDKITNILKDGDSNYLVPVLLMYEKI